MWLGGKKPSVQDQKKMTRFGGYRGPQRPAGFNFGQTVTYAAIVIHCPGIFFYLKTQVVEKNSSQFWKLGS